MMDSHRLDLLRYATVDLDTFWRALTSWNALIEVALLAACLAVAALMVKQWAGHRPEPGIWLAERVIDGALFPLLALILVGLAQWALAPVLPLVLLRLATAVLVCWWVVRMGARVLRQALPESLWARSMERSLSWVALVVFALWVTGLLREVVEALQAISWHLGGAGGTRVTLWALLQGLVSAVVVMLAALWVSSVIEHRLLPAAQDGGDRASLRKIAANGVRALLLLVGVLLAMSAAGIPLGALGVLGGAVGVGIGLGLQRLAANYVSGFVILAERSLRIGDIVKVDNFEGRVTDIQTRYTVIRAYNGREAIVPNETLMTQRIENASLADTRMALLTTVVVAHGTRLEELMPQIASAVAAVPRVLSEPAVMVLLSGFAPHGLELTVNFWIDDPQQGQGNVKSEVNLAIWRVLQSAGVRLPSTEVSVSSLSS